MLPTKFQSIGLSFQEKKRKKGFQDFDHGRHFGFWIGTIFDLRVTSMLPITILKSTGLSVQEKKGKIDFQDDGHDAILDFRLQQF